MQIATPSKLKKLTITQIQKIHSFINEQPQISLPYYIPNYKNFNLDLQDDEISLLDYIKNSNKRYTSNIQKYKIGINYSLQTESTAESESQDTEQQKLYRGFLKKIYTENYSASRLIKEQLTSIRPAINMDIFQKILLDMIKKISCQQQGKVISKINDIRKSAKIELDSPIKLIQFYKNFEQFMQMINILNDTHQQIKRKNNEIQQLLKYIQQNNIFKEAEDTGFSDNYNFTFLQELNIRQMLDNPLLKYICSLIKSLLNTNIIGLRQEKQVLLNLSFLVDCCFYQQKRQTVRNSKQKKIRKKKKIEEIDKNEKRLIKYLNNLIIPEQRMVCNLDEQFLQRFQILGNSKIN